MTDHHPRVLVVVLFESVLFGWLTLALARGLLGSTGTFSEFSPLLQAGLLLAVLVELLVPLAVYVDIYRRTDDPDWVWVHAATMPVVNLLGLVAYLDERRRSRE